MQEIEIPSEDPQEDEDVDTSNDDGKDDEDPREIFEAWLSEQDEKIKAMYEDNIAGLKSALAKERQAAKEAAKLQAELDKYKTDEEKELDVLRAEVAKLNEDKAEADKQAASATDALQNAHISFAVTVEALKQGFEDPEDALKLLPQDVVKYNKKTNEVDGVEEALKALAKEKPYLVLGQGPGTPSSKGSGKKSDEDKGPQPVVNF